MCATFGEAATDMTDSQGFVNLHNDLDFCKIQTLSGNPRVKLHTSAKIGEHRAIDLGGVVEQTNKQSDRQYDDNLFSKIQTFQGKSFTNRLPGLPPLDSCLRIETEFKNKSKLPKIPLPKYTSFTLWQYFAILPNRTNLACHRLQDDKSVTEHYIRNQLNRGTE
jgi:hypothetical protein